MGEGDETASNWLDSWSTIRTVCAFPILFACAPVGWESGIVRRATASLVLGAEHSVRASICDHRLAAGRRFETLKVSWPLRRSNTIWPVEISVRDNGLSARDEDVPKKFDAFFAARSNGMVGACHRPPMVDAQANHARLITA